jgi:predicted PolB exonuclease-like 3'-5' exonuclease
LLDCILSAREALAGPWVRTSVRDKSVRDKHSQVCQLPKNDNRPNGKVSTFFYNILVPNLASVDQNMNQKETIWRNTIKIHLYICLYKGERGKSWVHKSKAQLQ